MSVPNQTPIVETVANGNTVTFPYNFYVIKSEDLDVYVGGVMKTEGTDYTVSGIGTSQGGNVTFTAAAKPAAGVRVILRRQTPVERTTNYTYLGDLQASDLNADLDRIWLSLQEQRATFGSSISRPAGGVGNWDAQGFTISQLGDATQPQDAVTFKQLTTVNGNATDAANRAAQSASAAAASEQNAAGSASAASTSASSAAGSASTATTKATEASNSATSAYKWAVNPVDTEVTAGNYSALHWAAKAKGSADGASASAQSSAGSATTAVQAAQSATGEADRAKTEADKLGNMNALAAAISNVTGNNVVWKGTQTVLTEGAGDQDLVTVRQLRAATAGSSGSAALINGVMSNFIGAVDFWHGSTTAYPAGYLPGRGQILQRADYPELWAAINAGIFPSVTDAVWTADLSKRGQYSKGDGSTTFRLPDLNGGVSGSVAGVFLRGTGGPSDAGALGAIQDSAAPNIQASLSALGAIAWSAPTGAFTLAGGNAEQAAARSGASATGTVASFNAGNFSSVYGRDNATEVRPRSLTGTWIIRVNGSFTAANTNFSVFNGAASAPGNGVTVNGGVVASKYQVNGADYATAELRAQVTGGSTPKRSALLDIGDGNVKKSWMFGDAGELTAPAALRLMQALDFNSNADRRQSLANMGVTGANNFITIPVSQTQGIRILIGAVAPTTNANGDATVVYGSAFSSAPTPIICNGNGLIGGFSYGVTNAPRANGFDFRAYQGNGNIAANAQLQINYMAVGIVNLQ